MAGTPFTSIYDQFMQLVTDYKLINLFNASVTDFETYLSGFLIPAITDFKNCNQPLTYALMEFTETLTQENIKMLALLMKKYYLIKSIDDITQMNLHVLDKDFKIFSESNNMMAKQKRLIIEKEELSQILVEYGLENNALWTNWLAGTFYVP